MGIEPTDLVERSGDHAKGAPGTPEDRSRPSSSAKALDLPRFPFFSLSGEIATALQAIAVRRNFVDGQLIHLQDDEARFLNVVLAGHVRMSYLMEDGSTLLHAVLADGDTFGELGVLVQSAYPDTATAAGPVALISLPTAALLDLARTHPALSDALARAVAVHYREYLALVRDLSLPSLPVRLARTLIRLADRSDAPPDRDTRSSQVIRAIVTQTDLGLMARGSRGSVNRALQAWQRAGWIALRDRNIIVLNRSALAAMTADR